MDRWAIVVVYGPAHDEFKPAFLSELSSFCSAIDCPLIVGGDFNILRTVLEKNKPSVLNSSFALFNYIINTMGLREIDMTGGKYTWSNK
jgi:hypothetical protein